MYSPRRILYKRRCNHCAFAFFCFFTLHMTWEVAFFETCPTPPMSSANTKKTTCTSSYIEPFQNVTPSLTNMCINPGAFKKMPRLHKATTFTIGPENNREYPKTYFATKALRAAASPAPTATAPAAAGAAAERGTDQGLRVWPPTLPPCPP